MDSYDVVFRPLDGGIDQWKTTVGPHVATLCTVRKTYPASELGRGFRVVNDRKQYRVLAFVFDDFNSQRQVVARDERRGPVTGTVALPAAKACADDLP